MNSHHIYSERLTGWLVAGLLVLSVLAFDPRGFAPFGPMKWLAISTLVPLAFAATALQPIVVHRRATKAWAAVLAWAALSGVLAIDRFHAWFGTPDRRFGLQTWLLCALAFFVGVQLVQRRALSTLHRAIVVSGLGVGIYGLSEMADAAPVDLALSATRLGSTYGSPAYIGAAGALFLPILIGVALSEVGWWRGAAFISVGGFALVVLGSGTRGAWVGLAFSAAVVGFSKRTWLLDKPAFVVAFLFAIVAVAVMTPVGGRAVDAFDFGEGTTAGRLAEWQVGVDVVAQRPFSGAGPEGYRIVFPESVSESYAQTYGREVVVDRAHNGLIDVAATLGVPGLLLFVWLVVLVGRQVSDGFSSDDPVLIGTAAGLVSYLAQQQFLFPLAEVEPVFWLIAGSMLARVAPAHDLKQDFAIPRVVIVAAVGLGLAAGAAGLAEVVADSSAKEALDQALVGNNGPASSSAETAADMRPDSIRYAAVGAEVHRLDNNAGALEEALRHNSRGLRYSPRDPALRAGRGALLLALSRLDPAIELRNTALVEWEQLVAADPNNGRYQLQLGVAQIQTGDWVGAEQSWLRSAILAPRAIEPLVNLGIGYLAQNDLEKADEFWRRAESIDPLDPAVISLGREISGRS